MSKKLTFEKCSDIEWDGILNNSKQSTFFCTSLFLKNSGSKYHLWKVLQGQEFKAGVCLNVDNSEKNSIENELVIHNGIFFNLDSKRILAKVREDEFQITNFIIENLVKKYDKIFLSLDPSIKDVRPFQWYNYGEPKQKFNIEIKYTSILDLKEMDSNLKDDDLILFKNLEPVRRYSVRQAIKEGFNVEFSKNDKDFLILYKNFLKKNDLKNYDQKILTISNIIKDILNNNQGIISNIYDNCNNLIYSIVTGWDAHKAYYLYGVGSDKYKKPWQGTIGQWSIFRYIVNNTNIKKFDFEGVNSPQRGWFKLGFGGDLINYYQIKYDKKRKVHTNK
jgi:hypothetical protein